MTTRRAKNEKKEGSLATKGGEGRERGSICDCRGIDMGTKTLAVECSVQTTLRLQHVRGLFVKSLPFLKGAENE
ncbi:hypothetical protein ACLOJK_000062 [Asimina triloba]